MTTPHSHLRALALAAASASWPRHRALEALHAACSPSAVLALLDELERVMAGLREAVQWGEPYRGVMPPDSRVEILPTATRLAGVDRADRIAALRALAGEP